MHTLRSALCAAGALALVAGAARAGPLRMDGGWSRPVPAGLSTGVGYGVLVNDGARADRLVAASSPVAARVELHESMRMAGPMGSMAHMAPLAGLDVPAHGRAALAPNGYHLMLVGLKRPLARGAHVPLTLTFAHAGRVPAELEVRPTAP